MVLDFQNIGKLEREYTRGRCFVDGVEIYKPFYIDTEAGLVRTYDIGDDDRIRCTAGLTPAEYERGLREDWCRPKNGAVSRIVCGTVTVYRSDEDKCSREATANGNSENYSA